MHFDPLIEDKLFDSALSDTTKIDLPLRDLMVKTLNLKEKDFYMVTKRIFAWEIQDTVYFFFVSNEIFKVLYISIDKLILLDFENKKQFDNFFFKT